MQKLTTTQSPCIYSHIGTWRNHGAVPHSSKLFAGLAWVSTTEIPPAVANRGGHGGITILYQADAFRAASPQLPDCEQQVYNFTRRPRDQPASQALGYMKSNGNTEPFAIYTVAAL